VTDAGTAQPWRSLGAGLCAGIGFAAFVDEAVFHQLLHWHHLVDGATPAVGLVSDGVLHAVEVVALVAGLFLYADLNRRRAAVRSRFWAGVLLGAGGFQLYDGLVQHKLLALHQVRYGVDLLPYDLAWNLAGVVVALAGVVVLLVRRPERG
jgi:uncharacterized membrane protein